MMRTIKITNKLSWLSMAVIALALLLYGGLRDSGPLTQQDRIDSITMRLACPTCQGESVYVSRASAAEAIRTEVARQVGSGLRTDDETIAYIEQRFGGQVLLVPRSDGLDALVWALPVVALIVGAVALGVVFRKWRIADDGQASEQDIAIVTAAMATDNFIDEQS
ncbi:MAG: cytochrome c-type biogenesis protein CcmH [Actinobacteria bacterium]|nr:MAG: cytochrome c-type biogenesis protein CcmH [Actinomycetota bacterium]